MSKSTREGDSTNTTVSFYSSRRRPGVRRRSLTAMTHIKTDPPLLSQTSEQDEEFLPISPMIRNIKEILNEHLKMIQSLLLNSSDHSLTREKFYPRLVELSEQNPMYQRCSRIETKAFLDLITHFQMNRSHHYHFLLEKQPESFLTSPMNQSVRVSTTSYSENDDEPVIDGHLASNESSNTSSPALTRLTSTESKYDFNPDDQPYFLSPLRFFRQLSSNYLDDCEQTCQELTKLFDQADQQHILYCLKHVDYSETLTIFHRQLDALYVWYNLYYELTITMKKLSGLLRCDGYEDWPKIQIRSIATKLERKAKRAEEYEVDYFSNDELDETEESQIETISDDNSDENDQSDILPIVSDKSSLRIIEILFI